MQRRVLFKPVERGAVPGCGPLEETLELEDWGAGHRLRRVLRRRDGCAVRLDAEGRDPAELLRLIEAVQPQRQIEERTDCILARDYRLDASPGADSEATAPHLTATRLAAWLPGWRVTLTPSPLLSEPAAVELVNAESTAESTAAHPPQDVLAVLGAAWSPLRPRGDAWCGTLRLPRREPERSRDAERQLAVAASHLVRTWAEPPSRFHERWALARWRVYGRRALPLLGCFALIGATAALPRVHLSEHSAMRMLIFNAPPLLMGLFFCLREIPRIELPPPPRRSPAAAWREARPR